ncbi:MAG: hypothetical protein IPN80_13435 [Flavobacterium sp.]|nr:hypothetical protein [Flavobacterium sp.]
MKKKLLYWIFIFTFVPFIYSQNLVVNGDFSAGNSGFTSDYGFVTAPNLTGVSGKYGVVSNPNAWLSTNSNCGDHTTGLANMMVVDGSVANAGNDRVWIQTVPVTPGKNYSFTFWVQSVNIANLASMEVQINSVSIGAPVPAPSTIVCGNWLRLNYTWNSGASASAQIAIYDRVVQATGNDFAIDDIELVQLPTATISGGNTVCLNSTGNVITFTGADGVAPYTFVYNINGGSNLSVTSTTGDTATVQVPTDVAGPFTYNLVSVSYGTAPIYSQNQSGSALMTVLTLPTATISGDAFVCSGATGTVNFNGTPGATVTYTINSGASQTVTLSALGTASATSLPLTASSTYELVSIDSNGTTNCSQSLTGSATLSVPTATIFGSTVANIGESVVLSFFGTPGVTVNFTYSNPLPVAESVVLNAAGVGSYNVPYLTTTTVFSLVSATVGSCVTPLIGNATITILSACSLAGTGVVPLAEVDIVAPQAVCNVGQCTDLLAEYTRIASTDDGNATTDDYEVCLVPYSPSFPFTGGTVINATGDDSWSPIVTLPFTFNFYGNCYNNVLVGTNGVISFDIGVAAPLQVPLGYCNWPFTATIPNAGFPIKNAIFGVYQDTNIATPPVTLPLIQNVNYYVLDSGPNAAPNRVFVANFNELPQYSCNAGVGLQTSQIVIHETTNIIEVLVSKRTSCVGWNSGSGLIGILNQSGTLAEVPPGRNTGTWGAVNEAWRFIPIAEPAPITTQLTWELNGNPIGAVNENPLNICPTTAGTYSAVVTYKKCDGTTDEVRKDLVVDVAPPLPAADPVDITVCSSNLPPYTINIDQNALMLSTVPLADQGNYSIKYYENLNDAKNDAPTNIDFASVADLATYQVTVVPRTIYVRIEDLVTTGCYNIRSFVIDVVNSPSGTFSYPGSPYCNNDPVLKLPTLFALTSGGTFSATPAGLSINPATGAIDGVASTVGIYTVSYDIAATALCPAFNTTATVEVVGCSCNSYCLFGKPNCVCEYTNYPNNLHIINCSNDRFCAGCRFATGSDRCFCGKYFYNFWNTKHTWYLYIQCYIGDWNVR